MLFKSRSLSKSWKHSTVLAFTCMAVWWAAAMELGWDGQTGRAPPALSHPCSRARGGGPPGQSREERQDPQSLAQEPGSQRQHAHLHISITMVDHAQVNVHLGLDADQTLHHGGRRCKKAPVGLCLVLLPSDSLSVLTAASPLFAPAVSDRVWLTKRPSLLPHAGLTVTDK